MAKPSVDRLESNLNSKVLVLRIDIGSDIGKKISTKYESRTVPTFIALGKNGKEVWRQTGGVPDLETVLLLE